MRFTTRVLLAVAEWALGLALVLVLPQTVHHASAATGQDNEKIELYMIAGDYRRALETCQRGLDETPSVSGYVRLIYVYHAIDAYLEHLSREEQWTAVEQLYLNLAHRATEELVDPPGGLARMAKEMIQTGVRQQSDVAAAMANRLNKTETDRLWLEQARWRDAHPSGWWKSLPSDWMR